MSYDEKTLLIPVIETNVFENTSANFALGHIGCQDFRQLQLTDEFRGAARLRTEVYRKYGFITEGDLHDGLDIDKDDERAAHFMLLERVASTSSLARVITNMRVVVKDEEHPAPLFVERAFPEVFGGRSVPCGSVEVSRLISQHENPRIQSMGKWSLFGAGYSYVKARNHGPAFGLLAPHVTRDFIMQGVPITPLAGARRIAEINATKQPTEIDLNKLELTLENYGYREINTASGDFTYIDLATPSRGGQYGVS